MKHRNDGGYSLALVLVVMAVLALIATALMTATLRNMQTQEWKIEEMQDQYEAQGKLEKVLAELSLGSIVELQLKEAQESAVKNSIEVLCGSDVTFAAAQNNAFVFLKDLESGEPVEHAVNKSSETPFSYDFTLTAQSGKVTVTYDLQLKGNIAYSFSPRKNSSGTYEINPYLYMITSPYIIHKSVSVGGVE